MLGWGQHQPSRGKLLDDLRDPLVGVGPPVPHDVQGFGRWPEPDASFDRSSVGLGGPEERPHHLQRVDYLRYLFPDMVKSCYADALGYHVHEAKHELQLGDVLHRHLLHVLPPKRGPLQRKIGKLDVLEGEHALPGNQNVVEDSQGVHLVELARQRIIVEGVAGVV